MDRKEPVNISKEQKQNYLINLWYKSIATGNGDDKYFIEEEKKQNYNILLVITLIINKHKR
jgi:hypothetical protein